MSKQESRPIGLLDSGVGGLTVAREVARLMPEEDMIYYGDTLHLPYGPRPREQVRGYVWRIMDYLVRERQAGAVVLACNTATAFALKDARLRYRVPVFGTLDGACKRAARETRQKKIGIIGTEGTVKSGAYQQALQLLDGNLEVFAAACPEFVELVEEGVFTGERVRATAEEYLSGLREAGIDVLILGCTHFPYLIPVIEQVMGPEVVLVNPGVEAALEIRATLQSAPDREITKADSPSLISQQEFLVSDMQKVSREFLRQGSRFLGLPALQFRENNLFEGEENDS